MADPFAFRDVPRTGVIYVMSEAAARGFHYGHPDWANLGQGAPETGPIPGSAARISSVSIDEAAHEYSPVGGVLELREAVAALYNARYRRGMGSQYSAENVAIASGGRTALTRVATTLGPVNLGHILPDYTAYEELLEVFHEFIPIPIALQQHEAWTLPVARLRELVEGAGLGAILLSNPCNPTGHLIDGDELAAWTQAARELGCALLIDEFYAHYIYGDAVGRTVSACAHVEDVNRDPVVVVDGLTKNWRYPGWRLSWTVGPKAVIDRVISAGSFLDGGAPHPLQRAALPLLEPALADQEAAAISAHFGAKRTMMLEMASEMGLKVYGAPRGAFYLFASLEDLPPSLRTGEQLFRAALDRQVICVPGEFFDVNPGKRRSHIPSRLRSFVRLSFGPRPEAVRSGMERLRALIAEHRQA